VNADIIPALAAAGGGSALISGIWVHESRRARAMRQSRIRLGLRFPLALEPLRAFAALDSLSGLPYTDELIAEVTASEGRIGHYLSVPAAVRSSAESILTGVVGSLRVGEAPPSPTGGATICLRLFVPTPSLLVTDGGVEASRALLAGLAGLHSGEQIIIRWALRPSTPRPRSENGPQSQRAKDIELAWRRKTAARGFSVSGLVLVRAAKFGRARELAGHIESVLRARRGLAGGIRVTAERGNRRLSALPSTTRTSGWLSSAELLPLLAWPLGPEATPNVEVGSRELLVPRDVPRDGRRLFVGRDVFGKRPVALSTEAALHHMLAVAPSGSGKTWTLATAALSDIERGYGGAWIAPKGELELLLNRIKPEHADRIVVLDPGDISRPLPGLSVLAGGDPDLRSEVLTGALRSAFPAEAWGVRTDFYLRLAIRSLAGVDATLADAGRLFFDEPFRRAAVARLHDPFLVASWQGYEALSAPARAEQVQAPMNRIMGLLSRSRLRAALAAPNPKLDLVQLFAERKFLLANLAPGALGESGAAVLGSVLMYVIWSAIEARVSLPPERRHPIFLYLDELATLTHGTPFGFELLAERARGLGAGLTVALQTLGRIPEPTRGALLGNVASFITWRASAEEAPRIARQLPGLSDADVMSLGRFEVAARIGTGIGSSIAVVTGRTEPLPPETGQAEAIRDASAARYGSQPEPTPTLDDPATDGGDQDSVGRARRQA
jgi:hypothetical protein